MHQPPALVGTPDSAASCPRWVRGGDDPERLSEALAKVDYPLTIDDLKQDEDVLDTWFSSWLWPISVFDGINRPDNNDISYYYPTDDLVTAPESSSSG